LTAKASHCTAALTFAAGVAATDADATVDLSGTPKVEIPAGKPATGTDAAAVERCVQLHRPWPGWSG
jgi:hypothetical protein